VIEESVARRVIDRLMEVPVHHRDAHRAERFAQCGDIHLRRLQRRHLSRSTFQRGAELIQPPRTRDALSDAMASPRPGTFSINRSDSRRRIASRTGVRRMWNAAAICVSRMRWPGH